MSTAQRHWISIAVMAILSAAGWLYAEYNHNDRDIIQRVSALEQSKQDEQDEIHQMHTQLDQLMQWALGHK